MRDPDFDCCIGLTSPCAIFKITCKNIDKEKYDNNVEAIAYDIYCEACDFLVDYLYHIAEIENFTCYFLGKGKDLIFEARKIPISFDRDIPTYKTNMDIFDGNILIESIAGQFDFCFDHDDFYDNPAYHSTIAQSLEKLKSKFLLKNYPVKFDFGYAEITWKNNHMKKITRVEFAEYLDLTDLAPNEFLIKKFTVKQKNQNDDFKKFKYSSSDKKAFNKNLKNIMSSYLSKKMSSEEKNAFEKVLKFMENEDQQ